MEIVRQLASYVAAARERDLPDEARQAACWSVVAIARKVSLRLDAEFDRRFPAETLCRVSVRVGERRFVSPVTAPRGEASDPPSWHDLEEKLRIASRLVASPAQQDDLIEAVRQLRDGDHRPLVRAFSDLRLGNAVAGSPDMR
jgi:2-methylcitrate dehydratase PrpD